MFAEEQFLRRKFGDIYLNWSDKVNAFIPSFKNFKKPNMPFSWRKVLKKEKNGLFALFLIFCAFDILGEVIHERTDYNYFLIVMCVITGLSYVVLKLLKDNTSLLQEEDR